MTVITHSRFRSLAYAELESKVVYARQLIVEAVAHLFAEHKMATGLNATC